MSRQATQTIQRNLPRPISESFQRKIAPSVKISPKPTIPNRTTSRTSYYTFNVPSDTPRTELDDGSILIARHKPTTILPESYLPPRLDRYAESIPPLTKEQKEEIRRLRTEDPDRWTVSELAKEFETLPLYVVRCCAAPRERIEFVQKKDQERFDELPFRRKLTHIQRLRRRALW
ncbi:hypothetical protein HK097_008332 [Rhizophlyctis rosea]|uniref:Uncharacterized protein n=1 Tax=Rhizophlyctis rosea TaxID=64517 RepID=A0AAD5SCI3_9FUNG|nr:hypothetical protein HK097_008332 [Rhizophlyctis rosea]